MLYIDKNYLNVLEVTVTELTTLPLSAVTYLWEFDSHSTKNKSYFILVNTATTLVDQFQFLESATGNTLSEGLYDYSIYEQTSTINLDPTLTTSLVESGLCYVSGTTIPITYIKESGTINFKYA